MYKFSVYPDGAGFSVDLYYTATDRTMVEKPRAFFNFNRTAALMYAHKQFASWLNEHFTKYVNHADILFHTGSNGFYCTTRKMESIARLKDYTKVSMNDSTRGLVLQVLNLEQDMRNVLPSASNASYESSKERLEDMIEQCRRYRKIFIKSAL